MPEASDRSLLATYSAPFPYVCPTRLSRHAPGYPRLCGRVAQAYPTQRAILFGSRARGTEHDESHADVAVILKGQLGHFIKTKMAMNDIAYDILLDTGIRIQPFPVWESEWEHLERYSNPYLLRNIAAEGISL